MRQYVRRKSSRLVLALLILAGTLVGTPTARATCSGLSYTPGPFAYEAITVSNVAIGFTSATYAPAAGRASVAYVSIESNPISFTSDGTTPTAAIGHQVTAGQQIEVCGVPAVNQFRMIRTGSDATAKVTYFR